MLRVPGRRAGEDQLFVWSLRLPSLTGAAASAVASFIRITFSPHLLRWQRLAGLYLQLPLADVQQAIHQQAAQSARQHAELGLWHPAEALLWPWNARRLNPQPAIAPIPTSDALGEWRKQCAQLLQDPTPFTNVPQLTACAGAALEACGLKRIMLLLAFPAVWKRLRAGET